MSRRRLPLKSATLAAFALALAPVEARSAEMPGAPKSEILGACTKQESWKLSNAIPEEWREVLATLPEKGFDQFAVAVALREKAASPEAQALGEYLLGRAYFESKLYHLAHSQLQAMIAKDFVRVAPGVVAAAFECLNRVNHQYASLKLSAGSVQKLVQFPVNFVSPEARPSLWNAALGAIRANGGSPADRGELQDLVQFLNGSGLYGNFARAIVAEKKGDFASVVSELKVIVASLQRPDSITSRMDVVFLMLGRAHYTLGQYHDSALALVKVPRESNLLGQALSDLSWAYLMDEKLKEAIGTSINFQKTHLRRTFAPEAPMVLSMALNELCQYPHAIRAVKHFRKQYEKTYKFLYAWQQSRAQNKPIDLYRTLITHLKTKPSLPEMVATEWIRSPVFISLQDEINLLQDERSAIRRLMKPLKNEKKVLAEREKELRSEIAELTQKIKEERAKSRKLSSDLNEELRKVKLEIALFKYRKAAVPVWQRGLASFYHGTPKRDEALVARINHDLAVRNVRMVKSLLKVAENTQLVEIEIYDGASEDMVWKNANPDYAVQAKKFKEETARQNATAWNWGKVSFDMENEEVWEDELGWFKGEVGDECANREKYLKLRELES